MIIGTAGHIDHGKSALVTALTGRSMDRLAEERRRGITIDLNFAPLTFEGVPQVGIVDVPGHEDFVRTMVAGASGIDLVLLVVDAGEGLRPQTHEHLAIVEQLGIPTGIPVVTKADLVDPEWIELVLAELHERLAGSTVRFEPPAVVSARTGQGIDALRDRLRETARGAIVRTSDDLFRLPVDRVFSLPGVGTVVTGTAWSGTVRVGETVRLLPQDATARIRSIEMYGDAADASHPGARVALGLAGVDREAVDRGTTVVGSDTPWRVTHAVDTLVSLLPNAPRPLGPRTRVRVLHGTAEVIARVYPRAALPVGGTGLVRLALETPLVFRGDDRFVLRSYSPVVTIGGGSVVDPSPPRRAPWPAGLAGEPSARLGALVMRRAGGVREDEWPVLSGSTITGVVPLLRDVPEVEQVVRSDAIWWVSRPALERARRTALNIVNAFHLAEPSQPGLSVETLRRSLRVRPGIAEAVVTRLIDDGTLRTEGGLIALLGFRPHVAGGDAALDQVVESIRRAGLTAPTLADLELLVDLPDVAAVVRLAVGQGRLVAVERDRWLVPETLEEFRQVLHAVASASDGEVSPAAMREHTGLSRKFLIPLLEWADRQGITQRVGDGRRLRGGP